MRASVSDLAGQLPPGASAPRVRDDFGDVFALYYAITGEGYALPEIAAYAKALKKKLVRVPGVAKVRLLGVPEEAVHVAYRPMRLTRPGLSVERLAQILEGQNLLTSPGSVRAGDTKITIRPAAGVASLSAIEDLVIADLAGGRSIRLGDIATVTQRVRETTRNAALP